MVGALTMFKRFIKGSLKYTISSIGPHRWPVRNKLVVLMYHRILPANDPRIMDEQPGMYVHPETFQMHLKTIKQYFTPIHLSQWLQDLRTQKPLPKRSIAITFDDGWYDNYEYAYPILKQENIPASIFLVSDMVGTQKTFWPERLANWIRTSAHYYKNELNSDPKMSWLKNIGVNNVVPNNDAYIDIVDGIITTAKQYYTDSELNTLLDNLPIKKFSQKNNTTPDILGWNHVNEMLSSGVIEVGSHTRNHIRLNSMTDLQIMKDEIINSKKTIENHVNHKINLFCYPNGDMSSKAKEIVMQHYSAACSTKRGWNNKISDIYELKRIALHQDVSHNKSSFLAKLSSYL